jgi:hypothetical protein
MVKEFDHEKTLSDKVGMDLVRRISVQDRPAFFRYYMLLMFSRMAEKEGTPEVIKAMERAGIFRMVDDDTTKVWRGIFGKVPRFEPNLLGMVQTALRPRANPTGDRSELERDPQLAQTVSEVLQASPGAGHIQADDVVRCTGAAMWIYGHRNPAIQQVLMDDEEAANLSPEERLTKAMPDMLMLVYFLLLASGMYEKLIEGIVNNNPLLRRVGSGMVFERTPAGRYIEWIRK